MLYYSHGIVDDPDAATNLIQHYHDDRLTSCIQAVQAILDDDHIIWLPFLENAAHCGLVVLRSFGKLDLGDDPTVMDEFVDVGRALADSMTILLNAAKGYGDGVEQVPEYLSMCREFVMHLQGLVSDVGGLRSQDPEWFAFCVRLPSITELALKHKQRATKVVKDLYLGRPRRRRFAQDHKPPANEPSIPLPAIPPIVTDLTGCVLPLDNSGFPVARGGFADIWVGRWNGQKVRIIRAWHYHSSVFRLSEPGNQVAIKVVRFHSDDQKSRDKQKKRFRRELLIWQKLKHRHILDLFGTTQDFGPPSSTGMVCPWAEQGNLSDYLKRHHETMKLFERYRILYEVADGLSYLHSTSIVHGDLTGANVLLDTSASVCISDFGLSSVMAEFQETSSNSAITGAVRWTAPELYDVSSGGGESAPRPTALSDIFSLGRIMLQTLSGKVPFDYLRTDGQVFFELYKKLHPRRPFIPWITDVQWDFMTKCWADEPNSRPNLQDVKDFVHHYYEILVSAPNISNL